VVIVSASYEGQPPDNAVHFVYSLEFSIGKRDLVRPKCAVFGCGNIDWAGTYQRIPTLINNALFDRGAERVAPRGIANAAQGDIFSDFDSWKTESFWPAVG